MVNRVMLMQFADPDKSCFTLFHHPISPSFSCALSISFIDMILDDPPTEDAELHSGDTNPMLQHPFTTKVGRENRIRSNSARRDN